MTWDEFVGMLRKHGLSVNEWVQLCGITRAPVSQWKTNNRAPRWVGMVARLLDLLPAPERREVLSWVYVRPPKPWFKAQGHYMRAVVALKKWRDEWDQWDGAWKMRPANDESRIIAEQAIADAVARYTAQRAALAEAPGSAVLLARLDRLHAGYRLGSPTA